MDYNTQTMAVWVGSDHCGTGAFAIVAVVAVVVDFKKTFLHHIEYEVIGNYPKPWTGRNPQGAIHSNRIIRKWSGAHHVWYTSLPQTEAKARVAI